MCLYPKGLLLRLRSSLLESFLQSFHSREDDLQLRWRGACPWGPPVHIRAEAEPASPVILLDADLQADVALLHQVEERQTPPQVPTRNRHNQTQVALDQPSAGSLAILGLQLELQAVRRIQRLVSRRELAQGSFATFEPLSERYLFLRGQQLVVGDLPQVHRPGAAGQFFGKQPEATDRLGRRAFGFRIGIAPLGHLRAEEFFSFVQQIKAHSVFFAPGTLCEGSKKPPQPVDAAMGGGLGPPPGATQLTPRRTSLLPHGTTSHLIVNIFLVLRPASRGFRPTNDVTFGDVTVDPAASGSTVRQAFYLLELLFLLDYSPGKQRSETLPSACPRRGSHGCSRA